MYTIKQVATLSGTTPRTLRYYDDIKLFSPAYVGENGYRMYEESQLDQLQQILFLKQFGMTLSDIKTTLNSPSDQQLNLLIKHYKQLLHEQQQLDRQIKTLEQTIAYRKGEIDMTNEEKFEQFKSHLVQDNTKKYGDEVVEKYGEKAFNAANHHFKHLAQSDYENMLQAEVELFESLNALEAMTENKLNHPLAKTAFLSHKRWLTLANPNYSPIYHQQLVDMYLVDDRFNAYYKQSISQNSLEILKKIVYYYTSKT